MSQITLGISAMMALMAACGSTPIDPISGPGPAGSPPSGSGGGGGRTAPGIPTTPTNPSPNPAPQPSPAPAPTPAPTAAPPVCVCPASPFDTSPLQTIQLDGSRSYDPAGLPLRCAWDVTRRPSGSAEPLANANTAHATFFVDLAGEFQFKLSCKNSADLACAPCLVDVHSVPCRVAPQGTSCDGLSIQVTWDTPGVDLDVHMLRTTEGGSWWSAEDLYFGNRTPPWGGTNKNICSLDIDDTDGYGPEVINCRNTPRADTETYKIGVHYYSDNGAGATRATIRIYCYGALAAESDPVALQRTNDWWDVGTVTGPGCQVWITDPPQLTTRSQTNHP